MLYFVTLNLYFLMSNSLKGNISETVKASTNMRTNSVIAADILHRMVALRTSYSVTLTYIFKKKPPKHSSLTNVESLRKNV